MISMEVPVGYYGEDKKIKELENRLKEIEKMQSNSISKEIIENKIKELNQIKNTALTDRTVEMMNDKIQVLQDLLKEGENKNEKT